MAMKCDHIKRHITLTSDYIKRLLLHQGFLDVDSVYADCVTG